MQFEHLDPRVRWLTFLMRRKGGKYRARALNNAVHIHGADVASAATVALKDPFCQITGTTTITAIAEAGKGEIRRVIFTGALILTYNATTLILPTVANITTAAGDSAEFLSLGDGNWKCSIFQLASGVPLGVVPITLGGTGQITAVAGKDALTVQSSSIAAGSTIDLSAATGELVLITGSGSTVTSFGTVSAGALRSLRFGGSNTLTHNASSLILPTAANISATTNDRMDLRSLGSGNWICTQYTLADGTILPTLPITKGGTSNITAVAAVDALHTASSDIASAATVNLDNATGQTVTITGATTITAFTLATAGVVRRCRTSGAPKITYNATSLKTPGAADIQAAANDTFEVRSLGSGNVEVTNYVRAAVAPLVANVFGVSARLSLQSSTPVSTSDQTGKNTIYAVPFLGNQIPINNGVEWKSYLFDSQISILVSSTVSATMHSGTKVIDGLTDTSQLMRGMTVQGTSVGAAAVISTIDSVSQITVSVNSTASTTNDVTFKIPVSKVFDIFAVVGSNPLVPIVLRFGNFWSSATVRADSVSQGFDGILSNTTVINSGDYNSIAATQGTYLGSGYTGVTAGFVEDAVATRYLWSYYHRVARPMASAEGTNSWTYSTAAYQQANASIANQLSFLVGISEEPVVAAVRAQCVSSGATYRVVRSGIGLDSTTVNSATIFDATNIDSSSRRPLGADYVGFPGIGYHYLAWLEYGGGTDTQTWNGDNAGVAQAGIVGYIMG